MKMMIRLGLAGLAMTMLIACGGEGGQESAGTVTAGVGRELSDVIESQAPSDDIGFELDEESTRLVSVSLSPDPPVAEERIRVNVNVSGPQMGPDAFQYEWKVAGHSFGGSDPVIMLPKLVKGDEVRVKVSLEQESDFRDEAEASSRVANFAPRVRDLRLRQVLDPEAGEEWVAEAWGDDPDGDKLEYEYTWLVNDKPTANDGPRLPTSELARGDTVRVRVVASDGEDESRVAESGTISIANASPEIRSTPPMLGADGRFVYQIEADDPDGDRGLRYELVKGPRGMEIDSLTGELSWTPELDQAGNHEVEVAVDDQHGGRASQVFSIPIVVDTGGSSEPVPAAIR